MQQRQILDEQDLQEALNVTEAIDEDRSQQRSQGGVVPDNFTHGTSAQHPSWFKLRLIVYRLKQVIIMPPSEA